MPSSRVRITPRPTPQALAPHAPTWPAVDAVATTLPTATVVTAPESATPDTASRRLVQDRGTLLTPRDVASILGIPVKRVYELPIPKIRIGLKGARGVAYNPYTVADWLSSRTEQPGTAPQRAAWMPANAAGGPDLSVTDVARVLRVRAANVRQLGIPASEAYIRERGGRMTWDARDVSEFIAAREAESARDVAADASTALRVALGAIARAVYRAD